MLHEEWNENKLRSYVRNARPWNQIVPILDRSFTSLNRSHSGCLLRLKPLFLNDKIQLNWNPNKSHLDFYHMKFEASFEQMRKSTFTTNIEIVVDWRWCTEIAKKTEKKICLEFMMSSRSFFLLLKKKTQRKQMKIWNEVEKR